MKKIILSIMLITVLTLSLFISPKVNADESETNELDVLAEMVDAYIADGTLPSWHSKYKTNPEYQEYFTHFIGYNIIESFGEMTEDELIFFINSFESYSNDMKVKILKETKNSMNGITTNH